MFVISKRCMQRELIVDSLVIRQTNFKPIIWGCGVRGVWNSQSSREGMLHPVSNEPPEAVC